MGGIFPRVLSPMPSALFAYNGKECFKVTRDCPMKHYIKPQYMDMATIEITGNHFLTTKKGWLDAAAFSLYELKPKYKALLGDKNGPFMGFY